MINPKHIYFQSHQLRKLVIPFFLFSDNQAGYSNVISGTLSYMVRGMGYVTQSGTVGQWGCAQLEHYFSWRFHFRTYTLWLSIQMLTYYNGFHDIFDIDIVLRSKQSVVGVLGRAWLHAPCFGSVCPIRSTYWWLTDWQHRDTLLPTCF